jgi:fatty-acyl-CoA synthase
MDMDTIARRLENLAAEHGSRPALFFRDEPVTFAGLAAEAREVAGSLALLGVSKGTRVGILMPNRPDWLRCAFGAWRLGAVVVPINTLFRAPEIAHALRHADVTVLLTVSDFLKNDYARILRRLCPELTERGSSATHQCTALPSLRRVVCQGRDVPRGAIAWEDFRASGASPPDEWTGAAVESVVPSDDAAVFFTSGSTASPKGVVHTHASILQAADNVGDRLGLTPDDRTYGYLPLFFNGGLVAVALATLSRGGAVLMQDVFEPGEALRTMERHGCTTLFAWPHQAEALIRHPAFDRGRLKVRKGTGANARWAAELYPADHQAIGTWGMTETGPMASSSRWEDPVATRAGSHGRAMPGLELRIADPETNQPLPAGSEGEILVRGSSVMRTYYKCAPAECFDGEGFFHTGDCGRLDQTDHLHFVGRIKEVIKTAGVNVAAAEVEAVLMAHPAVKVAHVVPVPDPRRGENVAAFLVRSDASCGEADLISHCRANLASYKVPRHWFFVHESELPTLGSGKVDRRRLRRLAAERTGRAAPPSAAS